MGTCSQHFDYSEFGVDPATAPDWVVSNIKFLCDHILEPARVHFGPCHILSGYRSSEKQAAIWAARLAVCGGDEAQARLTVAPPGHSQHELAKAADVYFDGVTPSAAAAFFETLPQVGGIGIYPTFTHVDFRPRTDGTIARW